MAAGQTLRDFLMTVDTTAPAEDKMDAIVAAFATGGFTTQGSLAGLTEDPLCQGPDK